MKNLEGFLNLKISQISNYKSEKVVLFRSFYDEIPNDKLKEIFSILHCSMNELFSYINHKNSPGRGGHCNAHESRLLIELIDFIRVLQASLEDDYNFEIAEEYKDVLDISRTFLSGSGGSPIPEDFKIITLIEGKPAFTLIDSTVVNMPASNNSVKLKQIGEGSYARVFKYKDPYYGIQFVIKRAKDSLRVDELERFKNEFNDLMALDSPFIIKAFLYNDEKNEYIMEFADETLGEYILRNNNTLSFDKRRAIIIQMLNAFEYIHEKKYLHRDISYYNILVKHFDDGSSIIKVSDFGLVKRPESTLTRQGTEVKGAINDYSDLTLVGFENYEIKHETYALTKVIYFMLTGRQSDYHREKNIKLKEFVLKGISSNKNERYKNVEEIKRELIVEVFPSLRSKSQVS
ncbi:protein kinase [Paenibacillus sp. WQ 127069]|uniref:Protein kinase n=1 Tax=Paenibacillus baimaensis TaxID=2982185 RepID=A0ABT2UCI9_9BACL|nr:protein kinase [Paenibacillus sp. WQ 127069]MCU6792353.1 protein kinase [Paenibacillus sp. WQ 127069]